MNKRLLTASAAVLATATAATAATAANAASDIRVIDMRCEYRTNPLGVDSTSPRLSWVLTSSTRGQKQTAYRVFVATTRAALRSGDHNTPLWRRGDGGEVLWDSGKIISDNTVGIRYHGKPLASGRQYWWKVRVWDVAGHTVDSTAGSWRMGLLSPLSGGEGAEERWKAHWIAANTPRDVHIDGNTLPPPAYLRHGFDVDKPVKQATAFVTARGAYELHLNGARVTDDVLAPGWTDFNKRIEYQTYDVTKALRHGQNMIGAILGDGWYCGYIGFSRGRDYYGDRPELRLQLEIDYADGTRQTVITDRNWQARTGPIIYSDMLQGERYDARLAIPGWDQPLDAGSEFHIPHSTFHISSSWSPVLDVSTRPLSQRDVTAQIAAMVSNNTLTVVAGNQIDGDPAYGRVKQLTVDYTVDGKSHTATVREGETLTIPSTDQPASSSPLPSEERAGSGEGLGVRALVIRKAVYGLPEAPTPELVGEHGPPIRVTGHIKPVKLTEPKPGMYVFDLGQNMVGWVRLAVDAPAGTEIRLRFAEMLNPDGTVYTANLRSAKATDTYICAGHSVGATNSTFHIPNSKFPETWEPHFTFHGFRYVEMTGYPGRPPLDSILGCVVGSDTPVTGTFRCSNKMVNQLQHNIDWGQRGNFLSVPTDCPQRDERLGWMGDAQIFARTATYNRDTAAFYEKWLQDVIDAQSTEGGFSDVSPRLVDFSDGAPAWGDAGVIVPWTTYQAYGDLGLIRRQWPSMVAWMDYIGSANPNGLWLNRRNNDFGDWLSINADTPKDVLATAYYAYDASLMARMAKALGYDNQANAFSELFKYIKAAFNKAYVTPDGRVKGDTQTCYVLALHFDLLPDNLRPLAARHLVDNIASRGNHLSTGFVGVGYLCPTLSDAGRDDIAYKLLLNDTFPSWGYSIKQGATTIWERWDGWTVDKGFQDPGMNSFNHYSLGSVGQWLYQYVAGIDTDPNRPGFAHILLRPHPGPGLTWVDAAYNSVHGRIVSKWSTADGIFHWTVTVPCNTTATICIPTTDPSSITESGNPIDKVPGITRRGSTAEFEVQSGTYNFAASTSRL